MIDQHMVDDQPRFAVADAGEIFVKVVPHRLFGNGAEHHIFHGVHFSMKPEGCLFAAAFAPDFVIFEFEHCSMSSSYSGCR